MEQNSGNDRNTTGTAPSLEDLIQTIDRKVDQVPSLPTAEGFAAFLGGRAEDYQRQGEQYIRFQLNDNMFALPLESTLSIDNLPDIIPLPNIPEWVLGICNLRGEIVSVVDITQILQLKQIETDTAKKLIMIRSKEVSTAIVVDKISGMMMADYHDHQKDKETAIDRPPSKYIKYILTSGQKPVHLLDLDELMTAIEI